MLRFPVQQRKDAKITFSPTQISGTFSDCHLQLLCDLTWKD